MARVGVGVMVVIIASVGLVVRLMVRVEVRELVLMTVFVFDLIYIPIDS